MDRQAWADEQQREEDQRQQERMWLVRSKPLMTLHSGFSRSPGIAETARFSRMIRARCQPGGAA